MANGRIVDPVTPPRIQAVDLRPEEDEPEEVTEQPILIDYL